MNPHVATTQSANQTVQESTLHLQRVDELILAILSEQDPRICEVGHYVMQARGKRLRPTLVCLVAQCFQEELSDDVIRLAAIVELLHAATLLHDDVIDASLLRRNRSTAHEVWDNKTSILVGDFLYSMAFQLIATIPNQQVVSVLAAATGEIITGELQQNQQCGQLDLSVEAYFQVIGKKTAVLFALCGQLPALICGASEEQVQAAYDFAYQFGMAYQLVDDCLDYCGDEETMGKCLGDDLRQAKPTLPLMYAYQQAQPEERAYLEQVFSGQHAPESARVIAIIRRTHALDLVKESIRAFDSKAKKSLSMLKTASLPSSMKLLNDFIDVCVQKLNDLDQ
jgi:octaprenyl-diphosphate synthase